MKLKATPGAWRIRSGVIVDLNDVLSIGYIRGKLDYPVGELMANARLIAAAPEMLEQLKVLRDKLIQYAGPEAALYEIGDANHIIAKAEGRDE